MATAAKRKPVTPLALKWLMISVGLTVLLLGLVTFWLPLPIGLPLSLVGLLILMRYSIVARRIMLSVARRYPATRRWLKKARALARPANAPNRSACKDRPQ